MAIGNLIAKLMSNQAFSRLRTVTAPCAFVLRAMPDPWAKSLTKSSLRALSAGRVRGLRCYRVLETRIVPEDQHDE